MIYKERGFTWTELVVVLSVILILAIIALPHYVKDGPRPKEPETKANCHTIQIALERYMTDNGHYPAYLLGGDIDGWLIWHQFNDWQNDIDMGDGRIASNEDVRDPLIEYDYMTSYPFNPFTRDGQSVIRRTSIKGSVEMGTGDPRFGYKGNVMGQGLDDPNFFCGAMNPGDFGWFEIETRRTLDRGVWMNVPEEFQNDTNLYYTFGGRRGSDGETIQTHWPGNFFYRATSSELFNGEGRLHPPNALGPRIGRYDRYILGGYGAQTTEGVDVIRFEPFDPDGNRVMWRCPEIESGETFTCGYEYFEAVDDYAHAGGLPEVFGGGDMYTGPFRLYTDPSVGPDGEFIYGAPDGIPDGVILVLTNGSEVDAYQR